jgi:hypothetical protein
MKTQHSPISINNWLALLSLLTLAINAANPAGAQTSPSPSPSPSINEIGIGGDVGGRIVFSIDQWPLVREQYCHRCQASNQVSVPEPTSILALTLFGGGALFFTQRKNKH